MKFAAPVNHISTWQFSLEAATLKPLKKNILKLTETPICFGDADHNLSRGTTQILATTKDFLSFSQGNIEIHCLI